MQAPKEIKNWVNWMRSKWGRKNGMIDSFFFDDPNMERKEANSKKNYRRNREKKVDDV